MPSSPPPKPTPGTQAALADPQRLYELAVQCPECEAEFAAEVFRSWRGREARLLREDFCGSAAVCAAWVRAHPDHQALGVDHDATVLAWSERHHLAALDAGQRDRVRLLAGDVLDPDPRDTVADAAADLVLALNFSYWLFRERAALLAYFRRVRTRLGAEGLFILDAYGGYDAHREIEERRTIDDGGGGFTYVWEQAYFEPISHDMRCHIHFEFPDGSRLAQAFSYTWRLWTLPELRDLLAEAGFRSSTVYWQGWDENDEPDGRFVPAREGEADAGWICYLVAEA